MQDLIPVENIAQKIYQIRGQKVMLDKDLAEMYGVKTQVLNQAVKRNIERFPDNFLITLTRDEIMRVSQTVIPSQTLKFSNNVNAFTEHGVVMLSSVLKSKRAVQVSIAVVDAFVKMREYLSTHKQIIDKLKKNDENFVIIFNVLKQLTDKPKEPIKQKQIGFKP
jgi:phage regulator Rha-like protein